MKSFRRGEQLTKKCNLGTELTEETNRFASVPPPQKIVIIIEMMKVYKSQSTVHSINHSKLVKHLSDLALSVLECKEEQEVVPAYSLVHM